MKGITKKHNMKSGRMRRCFAVAAFLLVAAMLSGSVFAYNGTYHEFRDGNVTLYLPEGWSSEEYDVDENGISGFERILYASGESSDTALELDVVYGTMPAGEALYFRGNKDEALAYYETYGSEEVSAYFSYAAGNADYSEITQETAEYYAGEWNDFLVVPVTATYEVDGQMDDFHYIVYLTAKMAYDDETLVHNLLVFSLPGGEEPITADAAELAQEIADEFYDYDYYNVMAGIVVEEPFLELDTDVVTDIILELVTTLATIGIILATIFMVFKRLLGKSKAYSRRKTRKQGNSNSFSETASLFQKAAGGFARLKGSAKDVLANAMQSGKPKADGWRRTKEAGDASVEKPNRPAVRPDRSERFRQQERKKDALQHGNNPQNHRKTTTQMRSRQAADAEARYRESLKTLLKSGLLTRKEMEDMLAQHQRNKARQQRH